MIKGVIFDVDGTLLDSMPIWHDVGARFLKTLHITPEPELGNTLFTMSLEEGACYLKEHYTLKQDIFQIQEGILQIVQDFYRNEVLLKSGVHRFLDYLKSHHIPMVLATAGDEKLIMCALKRLQVDSFFKAIFSCSQFQTTKKEATLYQVAAHYIGAKPQQICIFEDAYHALLTAKQAGFQTVAIADAANAQNLLQILTITDYYLKDYTSFESLLPLFY